MRYNVLDIVTVAIIGTVGVYVAKALSGIKTEDISPMSSENVAYKASDAAYKDLTNSDQSLGADIYDWLHPLETTQAVEQQIKFDLVNMGLWPQNEGAGPTVENAPYRYKIDPITGTVVNPIDGVFYDPDPVGE